jgi:hypothetical protein
MTGGIAMSNRAALVLIVFIIAYAVVASKFLDAYRDTTISESNTLTIHPCMLSGEYRSKWWTEERCHEWSGKYDGWKKHNR